MLIEGIKQKILYHDRTLKLVPGVGAFAGESTNRSGMVPLSPRQLTKIRDSLQSSTVGTRLESLHGRNISTFGVNASQRTPKMAKLQCYWQGDAKSHTLSLAARALCLGEAFTVDQTSNRFKTTTVWGTLAQDTLILGCPASCSRLV